MAAAVIMACSGLSFSRMSLINSVLFSVIILIPFLTIRMYVSIIIEIY